jgi:hypothetical protein
MKKISLIFIMFLVAIQFLHAQELQKFDYCEIVGSTKLLSNKVTISIDFGQETKYFSDTRYKDENGKTKTFNSMIDAMNFMGKQGWEFVQAYAITYSNNLDIYHYVLKKKVIEEDTNHEKTN